MTIFPKCNEGFRRLSLVAAVLMCVAGLGLIALLRYDHIHSANYRCSPVWADSYTCGETSLIACKAQRTKDEPECLAMALPSAFEIFPWLLGVAFATYVAALIVRTIGWIVQGFFARA